MESRHRIKGLKIERTAAVWDRFHVGMRVTVRMVHEAYHSGHAGRPTCHFKPGMTGYVDSVDIPYVRRSPGKSESFASVKFVHPGEQSPTEDRECRVAIDPMNLVPIGPAPLPHRPGTVRLIAAPSGSTLSPYTARDRAVLRACTGGVCLGIYGAEELERVRARLAAYALALEVVVDPVLQLPL